MAYHTEFWEEQVPKVHKHFANEMSSVKKRRIRDRFQKNALDHLDLDAIHTAIDWGCGGGLLTKMIPDHVDITLVDISQESLHRTVAYTGRDLKMIQITDPATLQIDFKQPDLMWCYGMIYNLTSLKDWRELANLWNEFVPKTIALQAKTAKSVIEAEDYFETFYDGLILTKKELLAPFQNYELAYYNREKMPAKYNYGYAVLKLK